MLTRSKSYIFCCQQLKFVHLRSIPANMRSYGYDTMAIDDIDFNYCCSSKLPYISCCIINVLFGANCSEEMTRARWFCKRFLPFNVYWECVWLLFAFELFKNLSSQTWMSCTCVMGVFRDLCVFRRAAQSNLCLNCCVCAHEEQGILLSVFQCVWLCVHELFSRLADVVDACFSFRQCVCPFA